MHWRTAAVEGLALIELLDVDAIVTDVNLAGMSGLEPEARALCGQDRS